MKYKSVLNSESHEYEICIPRQIAPLCKQTVELWDDPLLKEVESDDGNYPFYANVTQVGNGDILPWQNNALEFIVENYVPITKRLELYLRQLANQEMEYIIADEENQTIVNKLGLNTANGFRNFFSPISAHILDHAYADYAFYTIHLSYTYDDEHMLSVLMHRNKILGHGGVTEFCNRGDSVLEHAKIIAGLNNKMIDNLV